MTDTRALPSSYDPLPEQNIALIRIYTAYRLLLVLVLLGMFIVSPGDPLVGGSQPALFLYTMAGYFLFNLLTMVAWLPLVKRVRKQQLFAAFLIDILALTLAMHASGGVANGLGMLLVITVAACSLLLSGQLAIAIAALSSIAVLGDTSYLVLKGELRSNYFLTAGLLGVLYFCTSVFLQYLSRRVRSTQQLAQERALDISRLQQLNEMIVQRMRTGILVVNSDNQIQIMNDAAAELMDAEGLQRKVQANQGPALPAPIWRALLAWRESLELQTPPFRVTSTGPELLATFTALSADDQSDVLVFLEDNSLYSQRAQQIKLASLGRLAASIAHEIRNPLGAISHAAQLLKESEVLPAPDQRLAEIIQNHSVRMNRTVENVLQLSRRSPASPARLDLNNWLRQFTAEFRMPDGSEADILLIPHPGHPEVNVDSSQLQQVLANLVENGVRYSRQQTGRGTVTLQVRTGPQGDLSVLDIIDEGPGIPAEDEQKIFEPFFTTEPEGNGLGLFISRELCEANQARLDYVRTAEGKSCFRISFSHPDRKPNLGPVE